MAENDIEQALRQALYYISRNRDLPQGNALLRSPLVLANLLEQGFSDNAENRQDAAIRLCRQLINDYSLEEPTGQRAQEVHKRTFDVLEYLVRGKERKDIFSQRSYERYHAQGIKALAQKYAQRLIRLSGTPKETLELDEARRQAHELGQAMNKDPTRIDVLAMIEITEAATVIELHNHYQEAQAYFELVLNRVGLAPINRVTLNEKLQATSHLAHCCMNQNEVAAAIGHFKELRALALSLDDRWDQVHSLHMLGVTYDMLGAWQTALAFLDQAQAETWKVPDRDFRIAWIQRDKMTSLITKGDFRDIPNLARQSLTMRNKLHDEQGAMLTLEAWGRVLILQKEYKQARARLREALSIVNATPSMLYHAMLYISLAELYLSSGDPEQGSHYASDAQHLIMQYGLWHQLKRLVSVLDQHSTALPDKTFHQ